MSLQVTLKSNQMPMLERWTWVKKTESPPRSGGMLRKLSRQWKRRFLRIQPNDLCVTYYKDECTLNPLARVGLPNAQVTLAKSGAIHRTHKNKTIQDDHIVVLVPGTEDSQYEICLDSQDEAEELLATIKYIQKTVAARKRAAREELDDDASVRAQRLFALRVQLKDFYRARDPAREKNVDPLFAKFKYPEVARAVRAKYGEMPEGWDAELELWEEEYGGSVECPVDSVPGSSWSCGPTVEDSRGDGDSSLGLSDGEEEGDRMSDGEEERDRMSDGEEDTPHQTTTWRPVSDAHHDGGIGTEDKRAEQAENSELLEFVQTGDMSAAEMERMLGLLDRIEALESLSESESAAAQPWGMSTGEAERLLGLMDRIDALERLASA